jgi:catechol 2,3-dioxygenase-like lactoylglutathione lyase family enzyme
VTSPYLGLWHLALNVRDIERMERFYVDIMEMRVDWRPDPKNVYLTGGRDNLALHAVEGLPPPGTLGVLDHLGFVVETHEEVDRWHARIAGMYGKTDTEPRTHRDGARSFYFRDPEENRIQLICLEHRIGVLSSSK